MSYFGVTNHAFIAGWLTLSYFGFSKVLSQPALFCWFESTCFLLLCWVNLLLFAVLSQPALSCCVESTASRKHLVVKKSVYRHYWYIIQLECSTREGLLNQFIWHSACCHQYTAAPCCAWVKARSPTGAAYHHLAFETAASDKVSVKTDFYPLSWITSNGWRSAEDRFVVWFDVKV